MEKPAVKVIPLPERHYICRVFENEHEPDYHEFFKAQVLYGRLHVMNDEGLHGLIDIDGREVVPCIWPEIDHHDEYCIIVSCAQDGSPPYPPQPFSYLAHRGVNLDCWGFLMDALRHDEPRWYGALAPDGRVLVPMEVEYVYQVFERLVPILGPRPEVKYDPWPYVLPDSELRGKRVSVDGISWYGYEDEDGNTLLPPEYYKISPIARHTLRAQHHSRYVEGVAGGGFHDYQLFDRQGKLVSPQWFDAFAVTETGLIAAHEADFHGGVLLYDEDRGSFTPTDYLSFKSGETIVPYYLVRSENGHGLADENGRLVLPMEYQWPQETEGRPRGLTALKDGRFYFIEIEE